MEIRRKVSCYSSFLYILLTFYLADGDTARCQPRSSIAPSDNLDRDSDIEIENLIENNGSDTAKTTNNLDNLSSPLNIKPLYTLSRWRHPKTRDGRLAVFIVLPTGALD